MDAHRVGRGPGRRGDGRCPARRPHADQRGDVAV